MNRIPEVQAKTASISGTFFVARNLVETYDPYIFIEEESVGYVRYRNITTGRRWEVFGVCDYRGDCIEGAIDPPLGPRENRLDVPVTPEFNSCCPFTYNELPRVGEINGNSS